ncbi:hypothetical protein NG798_22585 [Ancylothrix sp. C2]|uniref:hypothetical protein n=1 Tax=Ancylothrix sp. D3o TaxID=2953691 RepID=UPI0021BA8B83|nr:hypothetical protein [Ancylothrix sp. D3o]MCT7952588.1 hypothetical protein [Ancylothrix sp. D3o]
MPMGAGSNKIEITGIPGGQWSNSVSHRHKLKHGQITAPATQTKIGQIPYFIGPKKPEEIPYFTGPKKPEKITQPPNYFRIMRSATGPVEFTIRKFFHSQQKIQARFIGISRLLQRRWNFKGPVDGVVQVDFWRPVLRLEILKLMAIGGRHQRSGTPPASSPPLASPRPSAPSASSPPPTSPLPPAPPAPPAPTTPRLLTGITHIQRLHRPYCHHRHPKTSPTLAIFLSPPANIVSHIPPTSPKP